MSKFSYEEGELMIVDCMCEMCVHYNSGARSDARPNDLLDDITSNKVRCPNFKDPNAISLD